MNDAKMNLTIKGATDSELSSIEYRLRRESEIQELIKRIRRNSKSINYGRDQVEEGVPLSTPINELYHHGIKGMRWGVRRYQNPDGTLTSAGRKRYQPTSSDSSTTKKVKKDLANLSGSEFRKKYGTSNTTYMKRVDRYGDPYMNAPLAKVGKALEKEAQKNADRYMEKAAKKEEKKAAKPIEKPKRDAFAETDKKVEKLSPKDKKTWDRYMNAMLGSRDKVDDGDLYERVFSEFEEVRQDFSSKEINELLDELEHSDKTEAFLAHHGIKGMKWGIRRYQNPDGTRTAAGKRRDRKASSTDHKTASTLKKKSVKRLSNEELQTLNKRMQLEVQYKNLNKQNVIAAQRFVSTIAASVAADVIRAGLTSEVRKIHEDFLLKKAVKNLP